jgi:NitT/TauT family transport system ATP-binding protein
MMSDISSGALADITQEKDIGGKASACESKHVKIALRDLRYVYNIRVEGSNKKEEFLALENFSLSIDEGAFVAIVGPSGCGKSTLLDILAGLTVPKSGDIHIDGKLVTGPALDRGFVMQGYALLPWRTVIRNVEFGLEVKGISKKQRLDICKKFIDLVGLNGFENRYPNELSGGMRQRVSIARSLAYDPKVLLMDEPFAAVDAQTRETLQDELMRIWEKTRKTIIFITHSIEEAVLLADRVVVMTPRPGRIKKIVDIDLPRPRNAADMRVSADYKWISHKVWEILQNGNAPSPNANNVSDTGKDVADEISPSTIL